MAESDAAGPGAADSPRGESNRTYTLADAQRAAERSLAPLRAAAAAIERSTAPVLAIAKEYEERQRQIYAFLDNGVGRALREMLGQSAPIPFGLETSRRPPADLVTPASPPRPATTPAPAPEPGPAAAKLTPEEVRAALAPVLAELVEDIKRTVAEPKKPPTKRGDSTSERLRALFEEDPVFAVTKSLKEIGARIGRAKSSIAGEDCHFYHSKLKRLREKKEAAVALAANDAARRLPSKAQAGRAMRDHREWQAGVDEALDRDAGSHLGRAN